MSDSGKPCGINAAHDRVVAENAKLKQERDELKQTALNGTECSQCLTKPTEPVCMYCAKCYGERVAEVERLEGLLRQCKLFAMADDGGDSTVREMLAVPLDKIPYFVNERICDLECQAAEEKTDEN